MTVEYNKSKTDEELDLRAIQNVEKMSVKTETAENYEKICM